MSIAPDQQPQPTLPEGVPDDWRLDRDLPCPQCRYNLRTLHTPRCPECGLVYYWEEVLRVECPRCGKRLTHQDRSDCAACGLDLNWAVMLGGAPQAPDMYEYSARPLRRAFPTAAAVLLPKRFWKSFSLEMPPNVSRLRAWRRIALLTVVSCIVARCVTIIHYVTINWWSTGKLDLDWLSAPIAYAAMLLGVPLMTALILPLFTPTLAKFRIRDDQIARCMSYAYAGAAWTALFLAAAGVSEYTRFVIIGTYTDDWWGFLSDASQTLAGLSLAAAALWWPWFLHVALRNYLRLSRSDAFALVLSTQAITWLLALIAILTSSNMLSGPGGY